MRTAAEINTNIANLFDLNRNLAMQIEIIENEYQARTIEQISERCDFFDDMVAKLKSARETINALWHMEIDTRDYAIYGEID